MPSDTSGSAGEVRVKLTLDYQDLGTQLNEAEKRLGRRSGIPLKVTLETSAVTKIVNDAIKGIGPRMLDRVLIPVKVNSDDIKAKTNAAIKTAQGQIEALVIPVEWGDPGPPPGGNEQDRYAGIATAAAPVRQKRPRSTAMGGNVVPGRRFVAPVSIPRRAGGGPIGPLTALQRRRVAKFNAATASRLPIGHRHPGVRGTSVGRINDPFKGQVYVHPVTGDFMDMPEGVRDDFTPVLLSSASPGRQWRTPVVPEDERALPVRPGLPPTYVPGQNRKRPSRKRPQPWQPRGQGSITTAIFTAGGRSLTPVGSVTPRAIRGQEIVPPVLGRTVPRGWQPQGPHTPERRAMFGPLTPVTMHIGGGEVEMARGMPTGRIRMAGVGVVRPQGVPHSIYGDPRPKFGGLSQRSKIYFDRFGGERIERVNPETGEVVSSRPVGEFKKYVKPPVIQGRASKAAQEAMDETGRGVKGARISGEARTFVNVDEIENKRIAARHERIFDRKHRALQRSVDRSRRTHPSELDVASINAMLRDWEHYQTETALIRAGMEVDPRVGVIDLRSAEAPAKPPSPFQRLSKIIPSAGRVLKAHSEWLRSPTQRRADQVMDLARNMTAEFSERLHKKMLKTQEMGTEFDLAQNADVRQNLLTTYQFLLDSGYMTAEGISEEGRRYLRGAGGDPRLGRTVAKLPKARRKARSSRSDWMNKTIYDKYGNVVEHWDGPRAGLPMLGVPTADLAMGVAMGPAIVGEVQATNAEIEYHRMRAEREAYEARVREQWKKGGTYGSRKFDPTKVRVDKEGKEVPSWNLSDERFRDMYKNDSQREFYSAQISSLDKARNRVQNAGERLKSKRRAMGGGIGDPLEMPPQGGWWSKATNMAANAARTRYWERSGGMLGRLPGSPISFGEILGRAYVSESHEIRRSTPPFMDDLRGSWTRELDAMGWVRGREGPLPGAQAMPEGLPMQWTKGFTSDAYKSKLWQKFQAGDPESRQVMGALAGIRGRYPAREGFEDLIPDPRKIPRNAMGGALGRRLAQAKIQKAYDEGRYDEGQALQRELEASLGGWGGPAKPQTMSPFMQLRSEGRLPPKDMTRAMGGPLRRAGMGMTQLAPNWSGGVMPMLAMHPDAVLVGEHGPEVFVPDTGGDIYPNHYNGGYLPQFHAGGRLGPHPHPHRSDREGREVFFSERTGRWHQVGDPHRFGGQPMVRGPLGGGTYPTRSQRERAMSRMQRTGELFGPNAGSGRLTTFDVPASADPLNDPRTRRDYEAGLVDRTGRPPRTTGVVMPDDRTVQAPGQIQMFGPIGAFAQQPPIQGANVNVAGAQAQAPQAAGQQPPGQPPQPPIAPPPPPPGGGGNPNRAGPPPRVRLPAASPQQRTRGFLTAQASIGDIFQQLAEVRQEASNALQLSPVRALSVSVGQIFQEAFGGRRGIRTREAGARGAAGEAEALARRLQSQQEMFSTSVQQIRGLREESRVRRLAGTETPEQRAETLARIGVARERARGARAAAADLQAPVEEATIRAQILERGEGRTIRSRAPGEEGRVRAIAQQMRERGESTSGILTTKNLLQAQAIGLGGIVVGTKLFTAGIQLVDAALGKFNEALGPAIEATTGYVNTANMVAEELARVAQGGTGGAAEVAGAQAKIGLSTATPEIERRARLLAGAENFAQIQAQLRAEQNLGGRARTQGVFEGFNNGPLAGVPVIGDLFGWIGQTQSLAQRLEGVGNRIGPVSGVSAAAREDFLSRGGQDITTWLQTLLTGGGGFNKEALLGAGLINPAGTAFTTGTTLEDVGAALGFEPDQLESIRQRLGIPETSGDIAATPVATPEQQQQIDQVNALWSEVNDNLDKVDSTLGDFVVTLETGSEISKKTAQEFRDRGLGTLANIIEDFGIEFVDKGGNFVDRVADAMDAASLGASFQDPARILTSMTPAITAQIRGVMREAAFQRETVIPAQLSRQLIAQPQPTSGRVGLIPSGVGNFTGLGMLEEAATRVEGLRGDLAAMALTDQQLTDMLGVPQGVIDGVRDIGEEIRRLSEIDQDLQLGQEQEQYNEQLRISRRSIGDLVGLVGRQSAAYSRLVSVQDSGARVFDQQVIAATEYGRLQRAQIADSRQLSQIQLARSQRELNLQLALARLRSPGETAAERAVRRREAEALARSQQRELDINRRTTRRGFRIEDIGFGRQLGDALRAQGLAESERTINLRVRGSQAVQEALRTIQQQKLAFLDLSITVGTQIEEAAMRVQQTIEEASGQYLDDFEREVKRTMRIITREAIASYDEAKATIVGPVETPVETHRPGRTGPQDVGGQASGLMAYVNTPTSFIAGEAGAEQVLVIRNPKAGMLGGGGGGGRNVTININASVRDDRDVDSLVRKVIREIHQQAELVG